MILDIRQKLQRQEDASRRLFGFPFLDVPGARPEQCSADADSASGLSSIIDDI